MNNLEAWINSADRHTKNEFRAYRRANGLDDTQFKMALSKKITTKRSRFVLSTSTGIPEDDLFKEKEETQLKLNL